MTERSENTLHAEAFLPYMQDVARCAQSMAELGQLWRMIEASAKMSFAAEAQSLLPTIAATRGSFHRLQQDLLSNLVREKAVNVLDEIGTNAHYVIDIVVRNLYERTADIGFLATDHELCAFVAGLAGSPDQIRQRLQAYREKYTVYDEILLLDTQGRILANLDERLAVTRTSDTLLAESLASDGYVETFRASDLRPGKRHALIYSRRMLHPETRRAAGVLCLCFAFEDEMAAIFRTHRDPASCSNMLLLDAENRVIASADEVWIPVGATVPVNRHAGAECLMFGGRAYLAATMRAAGYQGYMGPPGWQGQVMIPLEAAFAAARRRAAALDPDIAEGLLSHAGSFCPQLQAIKAAADATAQTIQRVVWNGKIMSAGAQADAIRLRAILDQISDTGAGSNELFSTSIQSLYETVLASNLNQSRFTSRLLVDLLDRNLYERANDCRWWALTPDLRAALASSCSGTATAAGINAVLDYINQLYTVYSRLVVYDRAGTIIACSRADEGGDMLIGTRVDDAVLERTRLLRNHQGYHVSAFEPTELYGGRPTYVYHAAIRHPEDSATVVGGIGIVFDAEAEFRAMLEGGIGGKKNTQAFFVDRSGRIIASSAVSHPAGSILSLDRDLLAIPKGESISKIIVHRGHYTIVGCTASSGYREFKNADGYQDEVVAVVMQSLGGVRHLDGSSGKAGALPALSPVSPGGRQFATFFIDGSLFAIPADRVVEALPASAMLRMSMGSRRESAGWLKLAARHGKEDEEFVGVVDLGYLVCATPCAADDNGSVVVMHRGEQCLGLLVGALHSLLAFDDRQIVANPLRGAGGGRLVSGVITLNGQCIIQVIDPDYLFQVFGRSSAVPQE